VSLEADKKAIKNGMMFELLFISFEEKLEAREFFPFVLSAGRQAYFL
jgi:hypothetical protein